jgi:NAD(P)-dependent dehydrogenase (short-subunit alcohol dehydrogenase family)
VRLSASTFIVTGGASGLGAASARMIVEGGGNVVIADVKDNEGAALALELGSAARFVHTDVTDEASGKGAIDVARATFGGVQGLVGCAGIVHGEKVVGKDAPHTLAGFRRAIDINLIGTFNLMRIASAAIARTEPADADNQRGVVINTASVAGLEGQTGQLAYSASKGGIIGMTVPAARDLSVIGIRVNTICPGIIDTPIYGAGPASEEFKAKLAAPVVFPKRMGTGDEFAQLVQALIENDYMNAEVIRFDGGIRFQPK